MKKSLKLFLAFALVIVPFLTTVPALAEGEEAVPGRGSIGTPATPAQAAVTKFLQMPCGTTRPNATFEFEMEFVEVLTGASAHVVVDGTNRVPSLTNPPVVAEREVSMASATLLTAEQRAQVGPFADDVCVYAITTSDFLTGITWTHPGQFLFRITEVMGTNTLPFLPGYVDSMFYDDTEFYLVVRVGITAEGILYVAYTATWEGRPDIDLEDITEDCEYQDLELDECIDLTDGKRDPDPSRPTPNWPAGMSQIYFLNTFIRRTEDDPSNPTDPVCPPDDEDCEPICDEDHPYYDNDCLPPGTLPPVTPGFDNAFMITKEVEGNLADQTRDFDFTAEVRLPSLVPNAPVLAWIYTRTDDGWTRGAAVPFINNNGIATPAADFQLRHDQALVFAPLPVGSQVMATERANDHGYTPEVTLVLGVSGVNTNFIYPARVGTAGAGVTTGDRTGAAPDFVDVPGADHRLGEGSNMAEFLNVNQDVPITGLLLNNLPIILVVAGALGFGMMIVVNQKRRAYE